MVDHKIPVLKKLRNSSISDYGDANLNGRNAQIQHNMKFINPIYEFYRIWFRDDDQNNCIEEHVVK